MSRLAIWGVAVHRKTHRLGEVTFRLPSDPQPHAVARFSPAMREEWREHLNRAKVILTRELR
jgi:hypothetical protein